MYMELREVLAALRAAWWLPMVGLVAGGLAAWAVSLAQTPIYQSSTQLFVSTTESTSIGDVFQGGQFSQQRVASYKHIVTGEQLAARVIAGLGLKLTPQELSNRMTAEAPIDTVIIDVTVSDPSPEQAQRIATAVGEEFGNYVAELETPKGQTTSPVRVTVTNPPDVPTVPSEPQILRNLLLGSMAGLLVGSVAAVLRARTRLVGGSHAAAAGSERRDAGQRETP